MKNPKNPVIKVVIDIGSSRIRVVLAQFVNKPTRPEANEVPPSEFLILAVGIISKSVLKNGAVTNIAAVSDAIRSTILMAEKNSGLKINSAIINISGEHIFALNDISEIPIDGRKVQHNDVVDVINEMKTSHESDNQRLLHIVQRQFIVDEHPHILEPIGMKADILRLDAHLIGTTHNAIENLCNSVRQAGIEIDAMVYSGLASSYFAATKDEREHGILVIDLGAGTTDMMLWYQGQPVFSMTLPIGGELVSSDLAIVLKTTRQTAEEIKRSHGSLLYSLPQTQFINIPSTGHRPSRKVATKDLVDIIRARYQEMFDVISETLQKVGIGRLPGDGIIFTGGAAQIPGLSEFAAHHFKSPIQVFTPDTITGMPDIFQHDAGMTTVLGLLRLEQIPIIDHIWARERKNDVFNRVREFFKRYILAEEE